MTTNRRPAAHAATGLAPTASKRRPATVLFTAIVTTAVAATAKKTEFGMPRVSPAEMLASRSVVWRGMPPDSHRTTAYSRAFMPRVAMMGLRPSRPITRPFRVPATSSTTRAMRTARKSGSRHRPPGGSR